MGSNIFAPLGRVLVEEVELENKSTGGIILAGESDPENKARYGKIASNGIAVGGHSNAVYEEGNNLFFGKYAGATVQHQGKKYISLLESEIVAIVN